MDDDTTIITELGIENLTPNEQQNVLDEYKIAIGDALLQDLSDEQQQEFQDIIDGHQNVIDLWLAEHAAGYQETDAYKGLAKDYENDLDKVSADKAYAAGLWVAVNRPDFEAVVAEIRERVKAHVDEYK